MADVNTTQINQSLAGLSQEVQALTSSIRNMLASQSNLQAAHAARERQQEDLNNDLAEFARQLRSGRRTNAEQEKLIREAVEAKKKELEAQKRLQKALEERARAMSQNQSADAIDRLTRSVQTARDAHRRASTTLSQSITSVENSFKGLIKSADWAGMALTWFGSAVRTQAQQLLTQNKANGGLVEGTGSLIEAMAAQQTEALKYKVDATTFANVTNGARQMFNAMGGTSNGLKELDGSIDRFTIMTGSFADGLKLAADTAKSFAEKGIRPTAVSMEMYQNDLVALRRQTGLSVEQAHQLYNSVAGDVESIDILRSARADEREAILRSQRALIQQSIAAGMSAEQAKEAAKMLNKMVAAKPLERLKQAAKVRALSGAMGLAGGEEAAQAITAGKRATPEQQRMLQEFSNRAANAMDAAAGQGLGTEIFATTLLDKLDLDQYYGKSSQFSTTLGDSLKNANGDLSQKFIDASKSGQAEMIKNVLGIYEQVKLVVSGQHWLGPIAAGVAAIAAIMLKGQILTGAGRLVGNAASRIGLGGRAAGAASAAATTAGAGGAAAAGGATQTASRFAGIGSKVAAVGKVAGALGGLIDAGVGINDLAEGKEQTERPKGWDMISPMRWGMYGGNKINEGIKWATGGDTLGGKLYDWVNGDVNPNKPTPMPITSTKKAESKTDQLKTLKDANSTLETATTTTADAVTQQVKKMDTSNDMLKSLVSLMEKQNEIAEKQLVAQTMTEKEKAQSTARDELRANSKFGSQYSYTS